MPNVLVASGTTAAPGPAAGLPADTCDSRLESDTGATVAAAAMTEAEVPRSAPGRAALPAPPAVAPGHQNLQQLLPEDPFQQGRSSMQELDASLPAPSAPSALPLLDQRTFECSTWQQQQQQQEDAASRSPLAAPAAGGLQDQAAGSGCHELLLLECQHLLWHQLSLPGLDQLDALLGATSWQQAALEAAAANASPTPRHAAGIVMPQSAGTSLAASSTDAGPTPPTAVTDSVMETDPGGDGLTETETTQSVAKAPLLLLQPAMSAPPVVSTAGEPSNSSISDGQHDCIVSTLEAAVSAPVEMPVADGNEQMLDPRLQGTAAQHDETQSTSTMPGRVSHNNVLHKSSRPLTSIRQLTADDIDDVDILPAAKRSKSPAYEAARNRNDEVAGDAAAGLRNAGAGLEGLDWLQMMRQ
eukprot:gene14294-21_t